MKIKYAIILAVLLTILSIGAVSASDAIHENKTLSDGLPLDVGYDDNIDDPYGDDGK